MRTVFIIEPCMTMSKTDVADEFNSEFVRQIEHYGISCYLINDFTLVMREHDIDEDAIIIVYNEDERDKRCSDSIKEFLNIALECNAEIWPVSLDKQKRNPVGIISTKQSYDVYEQLRCRNLDNSYITTVAKIFSRKVIAVVLNNCYCETGMIFLSHRRIDGEEITAKIYDKMNIMARRSNPFRDVVDVEVGKEAQGVIDDVMEKSDIFVFIHTPKAAESEWILKELRFAMLRNIPILWVQVDNADVNGLRIKPSEKPHLKCESNDFKDEQKLTDIVEKILEEAFKLIMERSKQILGYIDYLRTIFGENISVIDDQRMLYHISIDRRGYHYPQRKIEQYCQLYGRTPTEDDAMRLSDEIRDNSKDSTVILSNRIVSGKLKNNVYFDNMQDFCYYWERYINGKTKGNNNMEIVISGAFPDADEIFKQSLTDALVLFSKVIIQSGYELTFGAHPTFQELFYEVARETEPENYKSKINMYISKWFLEKEPEKEKTYNKKYSIHVTEKRDSLTLSLSEMRKEMIKRKEVKALVCLGGKIKNNKKEEGIREEIDLARQKDIPVFIVGSVGGCSSEAAVEYKKIGWHKLNNASDELNQEFLEGIDYYGMAKKMIEFIGG
ncbi:TIR domain-containing protein [Eubacterium sp. MSJ-13]|uniref:SLOG domain-containing protein n=1 Tax=Eubacterium sp. MSJ-13 TaxID=2841513 RepID=UPI001C118F3B|nr:TIR domain-containing protein [Eubacterium sp. MSJ-13]MBU5478277.1 TIR domain-containing protein [Eubacterium sp. MSJ-13]